MDSGRTTEPRLLETLSDSSVRQIVDAAAEVVLVLDGAGAVQTATGQVLSLLGHQPETLAGEPVTALFPGDRTANTDVGTTEAFRSTLLDPGTRDVTLPVETGDGGVVTVSVSVVPGDDGTVCLLDAADRSAQSPPAHTGQDLLDSVADPLYVLDSEGQFEQLNSAMAAYTGHERTGLVGRHCSELVPTGTHEDRVAPLAGPRDGGSESFEIPLLTSTGSLVLAEAHVTTLAGDSRTDARSVGVLRDIQDRKRRERDLKLLKEVLTRVFRHNVRNELTVVKGHADLLDRGADDTATHTDRILTAAERLLEHTEKARLLEQVVGTERLVEFDLGTTVEQLVRAARERYPDASIHLDVEQETVEAHPEFPRAIEELLENAVEHAPADEPAQVSVRLDTQDQTHTLFVEDESGGLSDQEVTVLRRGREQDLEHSSGVGLWLVRWLVEYSAAEIIAHRTDQGTLMGIRFQDVTGPDGRRLDDTASPMIVAPDSVREASPERFRGETVVGRAEDLERLDETYELLEQRGGQVVLLAGEAGIGKTTLVERFREQLTGRDQPPTVATGVCDDEPRPPYYPIQQVMDDLPTGQEMEQVFDGVTALSANSADETRQRRRALFADVAEQLRTAAADCPVVLVLEDMHQADPETADLFDYLVDEVGKWGHPVMFLGTYRPSELERPHTVLDIADRTAEMRRGTQFELEPLDRGELRSLVSATLGVEDVSESFARSFRERTGGTPLFATELALHLAEQVGPVERGTDLPDLAEAASVPETVERAVTERLETLPETAMSVLRTGAVVGVSFSFDVLREASTCPVDQLIECTDRLTRRQIWVRSGEEIEFVHGIVRDQVLDSLDDQRRERLCQRVAEAIETVHADALAPHAGRLATCYECTGAYETAVEYHLQAGSYASERYAHEEALERYRQAMSLARDHDATTDTTLAEVCADLGALLLQTGAVEDAADRADEGLSVAPDDSRVACRLLGIRSQVLATQGAFEQAHTAAQRQRELAVSLDDPLLESEALDQLGDIALRRSEHDRAREQYRQSLDIQRETGDRRSQADSLNSLGVLATIVGEYDRARGCYERGLDISRDLGDREGTANSLNNLGILAMERGEYDRARECYEEALETNTDIGDRRGEAVCLNSLGNLASKQGAYDLAREYLERSIDIHREMNDRHGVARSLHSLGRVATRRGAYDQARERYERSLEIRIDIDDRRGEAICRGGLGRVDIELGGHDRARESLTACLETARDVDAVKPEISALRHLGRLARLQGDHDRAVELLEESLAACEEGGDARDRAETRLERARLALARDRLDQARESLTGARATFAELEADHDRARADLVRGRLAAASDSPKKAREHWQSALETFERVAAPQDALAALEQLVRACRRRGEDQTAARYCRRAVTVLESAPVPVRREPREWLDRSPGEDTD